MSLNDGLEASGNHEASSNGPAQPSIETDLKPGPQTCDDSFDASAGQKRELDSLSAEKEKAHKRPRLDLSSSESLQAKEPPHCPICSRPCWWCNKPDAPPRIPSPVIEDYPESMDSSDSTTPSGLSHTSSQQKRKKREREDGQKYLAPKDDGFEVHILG